MCRVRGESLCSTCVKGPFLRRWGFLSVLSKSLLSSFIYRWGSWRFVIHRMVLHPPPSLFTGAGLEISFLSGGGSLKKVVDHYTSEDASLPPPTGGHVHPKRDDYAYAVVNSFAIHLTSTDTGNPVTYVRGLSTPDVPSSGGDAVDTHHILIMPSNKKCPSKCVTTHYRRNTDFVSQLCCRPSSYVLRGYYGGVSCSY